MTHGVTENTANLDYGNPDAGIYVESGGLNEATSDILAAGVEFYASNAADPGDYLVGEKVDIRGNGTPLRYMDKPSKDGSSQDCYNSQTGSIDPHYSSGPLNHWFYLASEGSGAKTVNGVSYNSPTCGGAPAVTAIGRDKALRIWYRTLSTYLTSNSRYPDARNGAVKAAKDLYGASSAECKGVEAAFTAIAVPAGTEKCDGTTTPPPTGGALTNGGFESGQTGWTGTSGPINNDTGRPAHSGSWKARGSVATDSRRPRRSRSRSQCRRRRPRRR
ncbi:M4 family metallopeptidase [Nocardioides convexus]|uniref:M4 family metallopeptidase n=1 Tax=Nocardioides convexus TaxID=2712224 RepID=UPI0024187BAE|nr:M4 family metallopeptidase [Nocardioides convexus]